ncbi:MAG: hypothetical protein HY958_10930 [Bacteroidia bacterium]|nr:hypothetical protein [Bacteroidia bacterium]
MQQLKLFETFDKDKLLYDLFQAYYDARKNKRNTINALKFEQYFESNLFALHEEIINRTYEPKPSICFVVNKPIKREIFAADFRDRVIHHLLFNYISPVFEKTFINDSYSCRTGKGTHYGIQRIDRFIRSCSQNYTKDCYILKLDIKGYFMAMNKNLLYKMLTEHIRKVKNQIQFDIPFVFYLLEKTIFNDPKIGCIVKGQTHDWEGLPPTKSLFHAKKNCGLPIGNLTSQLFGNIYMNPFDHFVKRDLKIKYYGRYVDDFVLIHNDKEYLNSIIPTLYNFLLVPLSGVEGSGLQLKLHPEKIYFQHYSKGVQFLGALIKPNRIYIAQRTKGNFYAAIEKQNIIIRNHKPDKREINNFQSCMNSYLGIMKHYKTYKIRKRLIKNRLSGYWWNLVNLRGGYHKFELKKKT